MWLSLWSHARYDLRLSDDEFWELTPRQIDALGKRHKRQTEEQEFLFAQLTAYVVNFSHWPPKEPAEPRHFMPSEMRKLASAKPKRINRKTLMDDTRAYFARARGRADGLR